jgi:hypothetical protein
MDDYSWNEKIARERLVEAGLVWPSTSGMSCLKMPA